MNITRNKLIVFGLLTVVVIVLAFVIGYVSKSTDDCPVCASKKVKRSAQRLKTFQEIVGLMKTENLKSNLRFFAQKPHVASSSRTNIISKEIYSRFESYGFKPKYHSYETLLSFPKADHPNHVYIIKDDGTEIFKSRRIEKIFEDKENNSNSLPPFLAYGPSGSVEGDLVYVNYGRDIDYNFLQEEHGTNFTGKIALVKYGKSGRGAKVSIAAKRGILGVLIYGDPKDYAPSTKFPNGRWLSDDGVQRGSIVGYGKELVDGDLLTKGYPAKAEYYHEKKSDTRALPTILAQPISSLDATELLRRMGGAVVPDSWKGGLNVTYKIGPFANTTLKAKLVVTNELVIKKIRNVCGTIYGSVEPDRYVLLGNHIDAWVFGAVDASSGTTVMMEIARALGEQMKNKGWRPRRTIKMCGWDGEEFNLIGSCEYVEEFRNELRDRAVAYINIDSAVAGNYSLRTLASPLLHELIYKVNKLVPDPYLDMSVFDKAVRAYEDKNEPSLHRIYSLGAGSDYYAFYQFMGIPSIDYGYRQADLDKKYGTSYYPMYHTLHDTIYWMENFVDKEYKIHLTVAKVAAYCLLHLADSPLLPLNAQRYATSLNKSIADLTEFLFLKGIKKEGVSTELLTNSVAKFKDAVGNLTQKMKDFDVDEDDLKLRILNDKLMQLEKGFTYPVGLPGRSQVKNYIMAPSRHSVNYDVPLPAISDLLPTLNETKAWDQVKKQISITAYLIKSVADSIMETLV